MIEYLSERFAPGPMFGWASLVFLLMIPWVWIRSRRTNTLPTLRFSTIEPIKSLRPSFASRLWFLPPLFRTLTIIALLLAMARPQMGGEYRETREGIAIQMVIDVSGSMSEEDFLIDGQAVRRLDAVKKVFKDFVLGTNELKGRDSDLIGMTEFAMFADTTCPLTLDHGSLIDLLEDTEIPGWVDGRQVHEDPEAGYTSLGEAITLATDDLRRAGDQAIAGVPGSESAKSRIMVLLTDGKNNPAPLHAADAPDPIEAAKVAATLGIKVYTIGAIGSERLRRRSFGFFQRAGHQVDESSLKEIAAVTGGKYFRATDTDSLVTVYHEIDRLERRRTGERTFQDDTQAAGLAMMVGLALLMAEMVLVNTRYRRIP